MGIEAELMSILEYNGAAIIGMAGDGCVGIAADGRYGIQQMTVGTNFQKIFRVNDKTFLSGMDLIGAPVETDDFVVGGTCTEYLFGACESLYKPNMNKDELFETLAQALMSAVDRDCISGWGGVVHIITPTEIITKQLKGRMD